MKIPGGRSTNPAAVPARKDGPDCHARIAELEAEVASLRKVLAHVGVAVDQVAGMDASEFAIERIDRAADAGLARSDAATAKKGHGWEMTAGGADLAASQANDEALRSANVALEESRTALRERDERLHLILDSAADYAIFTTDLDRRVTSWNVGAERVLGWTADEIVG